MRSSILGFFLFITTLAFSQNNKPCACCDSAFRQFDFWIGTWEVFLVNEQRAGKNTIELIQDSCVLRENWVGAGGTTGTSFSYYDSKTKKWNQLWLDNAGTNLSMSGNFKDNQMVLFTETKYSTKNDVYYKDRITWTKNDNETVRQHWERTVNEGKTWQTLFDGTYKRVEN